MAQGSQFDSHSAATGCRVVNWSMLAMLTCCYGDKCIRCWEAEVRPHQGAQLTIGRRGMPRNIRVGLRAGSHDYSRKGENKDCSVTRPW